MDTSKLLRRDRIGLGTDYQPPANDLEACLVNIWQTLLCIDHVGVLDDFFELGGDSLQAIELFVRLEEKLDVRLSPSTVLDHPTVRELAVSLQNYEAFKADRCLVPLQTEGVGPPLLLIHEASGNLLSYKDLIRNLGPQRQIYGLQYPSQDKEQIPKLSVIEMAELYMDAVRQIQPDGPYFLAGYSLGGTIAYEMARQMCERGAQVGLLALIDAKTHESELRGLQRMARKLSRQFEVMSDLTIAKWPAHMAWEIKKELRAFRARRHRDGKDVLAQRGLPDRLRKLVNETLMSAWDEYRAPPYEGAIKLFRCSKGIGARWARRELGWSGLAAGGVEVFDIPADHYSAISGPTASLVAAHLHQLLDHGNVGRSIEELAPASPGHLSQGI